MLKLSQMVQTYTQTRLYTFAHIYTQNHLYTYAHTYTYVYTGYLAKVLTPEGDTQAVGAPVAILVDSKEDISKAAVSGSGGGSGGTAPAVTVPAPATATPVPAAATPAPAAASPSGGRIIASGWAKEVAARKGIDLRTIVSSRRDGLITERDLVGAATGVLAPQTSSWTSAPGVINATPKAKKAALENGLDVTKIKGTGNFNRVTEDDVLIAAGKKAPPAPPTQSVPAIPSASPAVSMPAEKSGPVDGIVQMTAMQKGVAKNMEKTLGVPIFRVSREIITDNFDALYAQLKPKGT